MSAPTTSGAPDGGHTIRTRRDVLAAGAAGALGAAVLAPGASQAQTGDPYPQYVLRERMPLNVRNFTASGSDDTAQIQAAIDEAHDQGGGTVYFPPGDYVVNGGLTIPETDGSTPIRLEGAGQVLGPLSASTRPVRLRRTSGSTPIITAGSASTDIVNAPISLEICNIMFRSGWSGTSGLIADFTSCNPLNLYNVTFAGGDGVRLRRVYNSNGSGLYFQGMQNTSVPALLFDALPVDQGGCATIHWTNVEWESNGGIDLKMDGYHVGGTNAPTLDVRITNWKCEGGYGGPHIDLEYVQGITLDDGYISFHGRGADPAILVNHPFDGSDASNKIPCLEIGYQGSDVTLDAIKINQGKLDIGQLNVYASATGPTRSAIRVESGAVTNALKLGQVRTNIATVVSDARPRATYANGIEVVPKVRLHRDTSQAITSGVFTAIQFTNERIDAGTATEHHTNTGADNKKLFCRTAGFYAICAELEFAASTLGTLRSAGVRLNGGVTIGGWAKSPPLGALTVNLGISTMYQLAAGDYLEVLVYHDAGTPGTATLNVNSPLATYSPELSMVYLSP